MPLRHSLSIPDDPAENTVDIWLIRRRLGVTDLKNTRLARYLTLLIDQRGFPPPLPTLVNQQLRSEVVMRSRWLRHAVEAWIDNFLPPENAAQVDTTAMRAAGDDMDDIARSGALRLIRGGKGA